MIDVFTPEYFDSALPKDKKTGGKLFHKLGVINGEHCWSMAMPNPRIRIVIRSSIKPNGLSADVGEDSIRIMLQVVHKNLWVNIGKGPDAYTTRVPGWEKRLEDKIKTVFYKAKTIKQRFEDTEVVRFSTKGQKENIGRPCVVEPRFRWLD